MVGVRVQVWVGRVREGGSVGLTGGCFDGMRGLSKGVRGVIVVYKA